MITHLRQAWRYLTEAEKAIKRSQKETATDLRESFLLLAIDLIQKAKSEIKSAVKKQK